MKGLDTIKRKGQQQLARLTDQHIKLAVTGLSGSGKSAFITSLVNQLLEANSTADLPFFSPSHEQRFVGARREPQPDIRYRRFDYEDAMDSIYSDPPRWPESTKGISQIRLKLKYQPESGLAQWVSHHRTLTLDITDYPGEWLLDLPLLNMSYDEWCKECGHQLSFGERKHLAQAFNCALEGIDLHKEADEKVLQDIAGIYTEFLLESKKQGFEIIQPGRFVLPAELEGAALLHFFPWVNHGEFNSNDFAAGSYFRVLSERFELYKKHVVTPFFKQHFRHFNRQIVLVDCLGSLNRGWHSFQELQKAINDILSGFHYGRNSLVSRLFQPKIDRLIFAASKCDHITSEQHPALTRLLMSVVNKARREMEYDGAALRSMVFSAVKSSTEGKVEHQGTNLRVLQGRVDDGSVQTIYPGEVPETCPSETFWQKQGFQFPSFVPPLVQPSDPLPHIRMDQVLEYLIGDKM